MLRIMEQDACTKDIFREMDGFLSLMSVLASLSVVPEDNGPPPEAMPMSPVIIEPTDQVEQDRRDCIKQVFTVLGQAMTGCPENEVYFRVRYVILTSLRRLLIDPVISRGK